MTSNSSRVSWYIGSHWQNRPPGARRCATVSYISSEYRLPALACQGMKRSETITSKYVCRRGEVAPAVVERRGVHIRIVQEAAVPRREMLPRPEWPLRGRPRSPWCAAAERGRRARTDAGRHPDEQHACGARMEEQRQQALAAARCVRPRFRPARSSCPGEAGRSSPVSTTVTMPRGALERRRAASPRSSRMSQRRVHRVEQNRRPSSAAHANPRTRAGGRARAATSSRRHGGKEEAGPQTEQRHRPRKPPRAPRRAPPRRLAPVSSPTERARAAAIIERGPERRQHRAGSQRARSGGQRRERRRCGRCTRRGPCSCRSSCSPPVNFTKHQTPATVAAPETSSAAGGNLARVQTAQQQRRELRAGGQREQEHEAHGGEGVHGVVQHLCEEQDPQNLEGR